MPFNLGMNRLHPVRRPPSPPRKICHTSPAGRHAPGPRFRLMDAHLTCPRGHRWPLPDAPARADGAPFLVCPVCGPVAEARLSTGDVPPDPVRSRPLRRRTADLGVARLPRRPVRRPTAPGGRLRNPLRSRSRRHGRRLPGPPKNPQPRRRPQDDPRRLPPPAAGTRPFPRRGRSHRQPPPPQHRPHPRNRRGRRPAVLLAGIRRGRQPGPAAARQAAAVAAGRPTHRRRRLRGGRRPPPGRRPPRPQAGQRPPRRRRPRRSARKVYPQSRRFRPRQAARRRPQDHHRLHPRHALLHGPRTGGRQDRRRRPRLRTSTPSAPITSTNCSPAGRPSRATRRWSPCSRSSPKTPSPRPGSRGGRRSTWRRFASNAPAKRSLHSRRTMSPPRPWPTTWNASSTAGPSWRGRRRPANA